MLRLIKLSWVNNYLNFYAHTIRRIGEGRAWIVSAQYAGSRGFNPHIRQHSFVEFGHEVISKVSLCLPLIQEGQLSVTGERMCTNTIEVYI